MAEIARRIEKDRALCDGTPRRERGYRAIVETLGPDRRFGSMVKRYVYSPLFDKELEAASWTVDLRPFAITAQKDQEV